MKVLRVPPMYRCIGLVDADLLDNGSRHPNLALLKIAGFLSDNGVMFQLILDSQADISRYDRIYLSYRRNNHSSRNYRKCQPR